jgi:hypothetical protein
MQQGAALRTYRLMAARLLVEPGNYKLFLFYYWRIGKPGATEPVASVTADPGVSPARINSPASENND